MKNPDSKSALLFLREGFILVYGIVPNPGHHTINILSQNLKWRLPPNITDFTYRGNSFDLTIFADLLPGVAVYQGAPSAVPTLQHHEDY